MEDAICHLNFQGENSGHKLLLNRLKAQNLSFIPTGSACLLPGREAWKPFLTKPFSVNQTARLARNKSFDYQFLIFTHLVCSNGPSK